MCPLATQGMGGAGGAGGAGGMDFGALLNNPALMSMASQVMSNPQMMSSIMGMMGGNAAGGAGGNAAGGAGGAPGGGMANLLNMFGGQQPNQQASQQPNQQPQQPPQLPPNLANLVGLPEMKKKPGWPF